MTAKGDVDILWKAISDFRKQAQQLKKYKSNAFYKTSYSDSRKALNKTLTYTKARISKSTNKQLSDKFSIVQSSVKKILSDMTLDELISAIDELELYWPELEIAAGKLSGSSPEFEIPKEIPMVDYRVDLEEAISTFEGGFYLPSLIMCRRAYETALVVLYRNKMNQDPLEDQKCPVCGKMIRPKAYMGISKLHKWAISKGFITERMESVGFLLSDLDAGAAHPPLTPFKRDPEIAKLGIVATIALLKEISSAIRETPTKP